MSANSATAIAIAPSVRIAAGRSAIDTWLSPEQAALHTLFGQGPIDRHPIDRRLADALAGAGLILNFLSSSSEPIHQRLRDSTEAGDARVISIDPRPTLDTLKSHHHITSQWTATIRAQGLAIADAAPALIALRPEPAPSANSMLHEAADSAVYALTGGRSIAEGVNPRYVGGAPKNEALKGRQRATPSESCCWPPSLHAKRRRTKVCPPRPASSSTPAPAATPNAGHPSVSRPSPTCSNPRPSTGC